MLKKKLKAVCDPLGVTFVYRKLKNLSTGLKSQPQRAANALLNSSSPVCFAGTKYYPLAAWPDLYDNIHTELVDFLEKKIGK